MIKEVKYDSVHKYIDECYCSKKQTIQLGWDILYHITITAMVITALLSALFLTVAPIGPWSFLFPGFFAFYTLLYFINYFWCLRDMQKEGHSIECSKLVAKQAAWRQARYSHYVINVKVINKPGKSRLRSTNIALLLWICTFAINSIYFIGFGGPEGGFRSIVFPVLFIISILASTYFLIVVRQKSWPITGMCVLNILSASLCLAFYVAIGLPAFL